MILAPRDQFNTRVKVDLIAARLARTAIETEAGHRLERPCHSGVSPVLRDCRFERETYERLKHSEHRSATGARDDTNDDRQARHMITS